jgi:hypothetical protein
MTFPPFEYCPFYEFTVKPGKKPLDNNYRVFTAINYSHNPEKKSGTVDSGFGRYRNS